MPWITQGTITAGSITAGSITATNITSGAVSTLVGNDCWGNLYHSIGGLSQVMTTASTQMQQLAMTILNGQVYQWSFPENTPSAVDYEAWRQAQEDARRVAAQRAAEWEREYAAQRQARARAQDRALELLLSWLDEDQRWSYRNNDYFEVQGSAGGWYRIRRHGQAGNVQELAVPHGDPVASWCCHPPGGLPDADAHLAQLLQIETAEHEFRRIGNRTPRLPIAA